jgi:hypothetical protein
VDAVCVQTYYRALGERIAWAEPVCAVSERIVIAVPDKEPIADPEFLGADRYVDGIFAEITEQVCRPPPGHDFFAVDIFFVAAGDPGRDIAATADTRE